MYNMKCATYIRTSNALCGQNLSKIILTAPFDNLIQEHGWEHYKDYIDVMANSKQNIGPQLIHDTQDKNSNILIVQEQSRITDCNRLIAQSFKELLNKRGDSL